MFCDHIRCNTRFVTQWVVLWVGIIVKTGHCFQAQKMNPTLGWTLDVMVTQQRSVVLGPSTHTVRFKTDQRWAMGHLASAVGEKYFDSKL